MPRTYAEENEILRCKKLSMTRRSHSTLTPAGKQRIDNLPDGIANQIERDDGGR